MNLKDYKNNYLIVALILLAIGIIALITGYGYSPLTGLRRVSSGTGAFIFFLAMSMLVMFFNFIYVHLKRRYRKKGFYKDEE